MAQWVEAMAVPHWEFGQFDTDNLYLAISPAGDPQQYEKTKYIISLAPLVQGWRFLPARPKRGIDWKSSVLLNSLGKFEVSEWQVVPYSYPDGMTELVFFDGPFSGLDPAEKWSLVESVICAEIGEDLLIRKVCLIDFERNPTPEMLSGAIPVSDLSKLAW